MSVSASLGKLVARFNTANANMGYGGLGKWPYEDEGPGEKEYTADLVAFTAEDGTFRHGNPAQELPAIVFQFHYRYADDPNVGELTFKGQPMILPIDESAEAALPSNQQIRVRISRDRLKGCLKGFTGEESPDIEQAVAFVQTKLDEAEAAQSIVQVRLKQNIRDTEKKQGDTVRKRRDKEDFIQELIAG